MGLVKSMCEPMCPEPRDGRCGAERRGVPLFMEGVEVRFLILFSG